MRTSTHGKLRIEANNTIYFTKEICQSAKQLWWSDFRFRISNFFILVENIYVSLHVFDYWADGRVCLF